MESQSRLGRRHLLHAAAALVATASLKPYVSAAQTPESVPLAMATFADKAAAAHELAQAWFLLLSATGSKTGELGTTDEMDAAAQAFIQPFLDPAFQLQRANGERYVAPTYVPVDIDLFSIEDLNETRPTDGLLVARYAVAAPGSSTADTNLVLSSDLRPRLTVFRRDDASAQWKVLSHANFNVPIATICEEQPLVPVSDPPVPTSAEDVALGVETVHALAAALLTGDIASVHDAEVQVQNAGGIGGTTILGLGENHYRTIETSNHLVTRNADVMVVSYRGLPSGISLGAPIEEAWRPRLVTFRQDESGAWKVIASAVFSTIADVPDTVQCMKAG